MSLKAVITNIGSSMLSECIAAGTIKYTKAEVGSGAYADETQAKAATALSAKYNNANVSISGVSYTGNAAQVSVQLSAAASSESRVEMTIREIGVYFSKSDTATPVLGCYAWYTDPDEAEHFSADALFNRIYDIVMAISGATTLTVTANFGGLQDKITASGILVGDGAGGVTALTPVTAYTTDENTVSKGNHTHALDEASVTGILPISKGGTGAQTKEVAQTNLGIPKVLYRTSVPTTVVDGAILLVPVS